MKLGEYVLSALWTVAAIWLGIEIGSTGDVPPGWGAVGCVCVGTLYGLGRVWRGR